MILKPGTLAKLRDDAWPAHELGIDYDCYNTNKFKLLPRRILCGQLVEIIGSEDDCYKAWMPLLQYYVTCFQRRFEPLAEHDNTR